MYNQYPGRGWGDNLRHRDPSLNLAAAWLFAEGKIYGGFGMDGSSVEER